MKKINHEERKAGRLILSQFKMFNQAAVLLEQTLLPAFWKGFDQCVERFVIDNAWAGEFTLEQKEYCWLAPKQWVVEGTSCKAWFENHVTQNNKYDYWLALLTGCATEKARFGFQFRPGFDYLGGAKAFNDYAKAIKPEFIQQLADLNFEHQGKGKFFLPIFLDTNKLAECWYENAEFSHDDEVFTPLREALSHLEKSYEIFDEMIQAAPITADSDV